MPVNIYGKEYKTVAERLEEAHATSDLLGVETVVLYLEPQVMVKATITTKKGVFTGISAADPKKPIEAKTPVEVAETSAVGRALAFAGYAGMEIASADEIRKALDTPQPTKKTVLPQKGIVTAKCQDCGAVMVKKEGEKEGRKWSGLFCPTNPREHKAIWL